MLSPYQGHEKKISREIIALLRKAKSKSEYDEMFREKVEQLKKSATAKDGMDANASKSLA